MASKVNIRRFSLAQMLFHFVLIITFMLLSVTGIAWMYIVTGWGKALAAPVGGICRAYPLHYLEDRLEALSRVVDQP